MSDAYKEKKKGPYHHGRLEEAIIEHGLARLEEGGEAAVNLRDIARDLDVSSGAPYRHFQDKADLLDALSVWGWQQFRTGLESKPDFPARVGFYREFGTRRPQLLTLMMRRCCDTDPRAADWAEASSRAFDLFTGDVAGLTGSVPFRDRIKATVVAWALIHGLATLESMPILADFVDVRTSDDEVVELLQRALGADPRTA